MIRNELQSSVTPLFAIVTVPVKGASSVQFETTVPPWMQPFAAAATRGVPAMRKSATNAERLLLPSSSLRAEAFRGPVFEEAAAIVVLFVVMVVSLS